MDRWLTETNTTRDELADRIKERVALYWIRRGYMDKARQASLRGVTRQTLWRWMTEQNDIPLLCAEAIEEICGVPKRMWMERAQSLKEVA